MEKSIDLLNNSYSMNFLKENIYAIHFWELLKTQKIDEYFAVKYILNKKFQMTEEEETITIEDILKYQPHMKKEKLLRILSMAHLIEYPDFEKYINDN